MFSLTEEAFGGKYIKVNVSSQEYHIYTYVIYNIYIYIYMIYIIYYIYNI